MKKLALVLLFVVLLLPAVEARTSVDISSFGMPGKGFLPGRPASFGFQLYNTGDKANTFNMCVDVMSRDSSWAGNGCKGTPSLNPGKGYYAQIAIYMPSNVPKGPYDVTFRVFDLNGNQIASKSFSGVLIVQ